MEPLCAGCERWRKEPLIWSSPRLAKERVNLVPFSLHCAQKKVCTKALKAQLTKTTSHRKGLAAWASPGQPPAETTMDRSPADPQPHTATFQMSGTQCRVAQPGEKSLVLMEKGSQEKPILRLAQMLWFSGRHQSNCYKGVWQTKEEDPLKQVDNGRPQLMPGGRIYRLAKFKMKHRNTRTENLKPLRLRIQRGMTKKPVGQSKGKEREMWGWGYAKPQDQWNDGRGIMLLTSECQKEERASSIALGL